MNTKNLAASMVVATALLVCGSASATEQPKIDRATAEKTALARVPGGHVREAELETEHGKLVWSFDIAKPASPDIAEVQVDAMTGEVVAVATETPADQAKEAAQEKREKKKTE